ncbi:MAG: hypothetical protein J5518_08495 [Lachnospiraceae bacterium]|nr:hypothetical protein [Lachnospiraceae bacterium]
MRESIISGTRENEGDIRAAAEKEWLDLLAENTRRTDERTKQLKEMNFRFHLDGGHEYDDIEKWFASELARIKKKYNIA